MGGGEAGLSALSLVPGPVGWVSTGLQLLGGVGKLFGGSKMDSSSAVSSNASVFGATTFGDTGINKPIIDLENPVHIGVLLAVVGLGVLIYKKVK